MNEIMLLSIFAFLLMSFKMGKVMKIKGVPKSNKILAWSIYGLSTAGLIGVNFLF